MLFLISFGVMYVSSEYLGVARLSQFLSFQAWDGPGPMPVEACPRPLGVHFFGDFLLSYRTAGHASPYFAVGYHDFAYLPMSAVLISPLFFFPFWFALSLFFISTVAVLVLACWKILSSIDALPRAIIVAVALVMSGPFLSSLDRANFSLLLSSLCLVGLLNFEGGRHERAAFFFGIAGAMKLYPLLFLLVYLNKRNWKCLFVGGTSFVISSIAPLFFYQGGFYANLREMLSQFTGSASVTHAAKIRAYNNSFYALFSAVTESSFLDVGRFARFFLINYEACIVMLFVLSFVCLLWAKAPDWHFFVVAAAFISSGPQISAQYVLLLYLLPLMLIIRFLASSDSHRETWAHCCLALIALLMVPKGFAFPNPLGYWSAASTSYASVVNPFVALLLIVGTVISACVNHAQRQVQDLSATC
jgi:hypothetical protein